MGFGMGVGCGAAGCVSGERVLTRWEAPRRSTLALLLACCAGCHVGQAACSILALSGRAADACACTAATNTPAIPLGPLGHHNSHTSHNYTTPTRQLTHPPMTSPAPPPTTPLPPQATFEDSMLEEAVAKNHCTIGEAVAAGQAAGAFLTMLTHFSQRYPKVPVLDHAEIQVGGWWGGGVGEGGGCGCGCGVVWWWQPTPEGWVRGCGGEWRAQPGRRGSSSLCGCAMVNCGQIHWQPPNCISACEVGGHGPEP